MAVPETDLHRIRLWAIYWRDRHLEFHEYKRKRPTKNVQTLLDHIETSDDPIFWG
jgi:hypothetical protein